MKSIHIEAPGVISDAHVRIDAATSSEELRQIPVAGLSLAERLHYQRRLDALEDAERRARSRARMDELAAIRAARAPAIRAPAAPPRVDRLDAMERIPDEENAQGCIRPVCLDGAFQVWNAHDPAIGPWPGLISPTCACGKHR